MGLSIALGCSSIRGVCPTRRGVFHETEASHETFEPCRPLLQRRSIAPERQGHRSSSRTPRGPTAPSIRVDHPRRLEELQGRVANPNHTSTDRPGHPCRCCPRGASGLRQPPKTSRERQRPSRCRRKQSVAGRGALRRGRAPLLASLVAWWCSLAQLHYYARFRQNHVCSPS